MNARRFEITAEEIGVVVARFYADIRHHPVLGPVFARHVTDWSEHESRIMSFWRNAILREQGYDGNPMFVHKKAGDIRAEMFPIWLDLFDKVLAANLTIDQAHNWSALAHRIGKGLSYGLVQAGDPPNLRR